MVFDYALDPHTDLKHSDIKIPVVESIINMNYNPPKKMQNDVKGYKNRHGNSGNGGNRYKRKRDHSSPLTFPKPKLQSRKGCTKI